MPFLLVLLLTCVKLLKLFIMKDFVNYLIAVVSMGCITGLLVSMGSQILLAMGVMSLFWAGMFAPMLRG